MLGLCLHERDAEVVIMEVAVFVLGAFYIFHAGIQSTSLQKKLEVTYNACVRDGEQSLQRLLSKVSVLALTSCLLN